MLDKDFLESLEILEKLQYEEIIESYSYNSKEGDFTFAAKVGEGNTKEKTLGYYDVEEKEILNIIEEWKKDFKNIAAAAEEEQKEYERDREIAYWAVQGVAI